MSRNFGDKSFESIGFPSVDSSQKYEAESSCQTDQIDFKSVDSQVYQLRNVQTQTSDEVKSTSPTDYTKLAAFLNRVTPQVLQELDKIQATNDIINLYTSNQSEESLYQVKLVSKVSSLQELELSLKTDRKIGALSWSINGGILAVGFSSISHDTWCNHQSELRLYEFTKQNEFNENTVKTYETNACVTCMSYHPTEPSILAAGLFNGDVILWNFTEDFSLTPLLICTHGDVVSSLSWRPRTIYDPSMLITTSLDGQILIHTLTVNFSKFDNHRRFKIVKKHNPVENARPKSAGGSREEAIEAGLSVTCLDFSSIDPIIFIIGTLCGGLYKCSLQSQTLITDSDTIIDPVVGEFDKHEGSLTAVKCSPTQSIFVSVGTDKEMRIYNIDQAEILRVITLPCTLTGLKWFIKEENTILGYGADPSVRFFDVSSGQLTDINIETTKDKINCLDFNIKRNTVALTDTCGNFEVWRIFKTN